MDVTEFDMFKDFTILNGYITLSKNSLLLSLLKKSILNRSQIQILSIFAALRQSL